MIAINRAIEVRLNGAKSITFVDVDKGIPVVLEVGHTLTLDAPIEVTAEGPGASGSYRLALVSLTITVVP